MLIPSQVILTYVRPSYWLPGLEIGWGIVTGLIAFTQNARQIYALRILLGMLESSAYPGMMTLFSESPRPMPDGMLISLVDTVVWYTPSELAKRIGFYHSCQAIGSMVSGALQVAILESLEGKLGLRGWRWLFVINAAMTLLIGVAGLFMLPDYPSRPNPRAIWLTPEHTEIGLRRLARNKRTESKEITWESARSVSFVESPEEG